MTERRFLFSNTELRAEGQGDEMSISGYAAAWNVLSSDLGGFRERICQGCFTRSLQSDRDVACLVNHDPSQILGRKKNGSLQVNEDSHGLKFRCVLPNTTFARDIHTLIRRGDLQECSFAFQKEDEDWSDVSDPDDPSHSVPLRTLKCCTLLDTSVVLSPAYPRGTSVSASAPKLNPLSTEALATNWSASTPRTLFPDGVPAEIRMRVPHIESTTSGKSARQKLLAFVIS